MRMSVPCFSHRQRRVFFLIPLLIFCLGAAYSARAADPAPSSAAPASSPAAQTAPAVDDGLNRIWSARAGDLATLTDEAENLRQNAENLAKPLTLDLQNARLRFSRLSGLFQASRGHPTEQLTLARQMHSLRSSLQNTIAPMDEISVTVKHMLDEAAGLQKDMESIVRESAADGVNLNAAANREAEVLQNYTRSLAAARKKLGSLSTRLDVLLAPAKGVLDRIDRTIEDIEGSLVDIWQDYYLTPTGAGLGALVAMPVLLTDWLVSLPSRLSFAYPQSPEEWQESGKNFLIYMVIMAVLGFACVRGTRALPIHRSRVRLRKAARALVSMGLGLVVLAASGNQYGGFYLAFSLSGAILLIVGTVSLIWGLRTALEPGLASVSSPMLRLLWPAFIGVLMLFADLPPRLLGIMWGLVTAAFLALAFFRRHRKKTRVKLPLLERFSRISSIWFGLASLLAAGLGYARLGVLIFIILLALVNSLSLGDSLMRIFAKAADRLLKPDEQPFSNAVARSVAIPLAWILSVVCALPWILVAPGARYILPQIFTASYTVGEASFDFSRLLLIAVLFFLFRSFISLGRTSLDHLPDRLPNIERGVIPPLRTMLGYAFWALFAIISLGLLGVNFTSLAVVAGGLSVGIGFGLQNIFNNMISGIMLIFGRTILVGDYVEVAGSAGTVRAINIRSTTIETGERAIVYVPNSAIMAGQFINWTRNSRMVRRSITVGVAYGSDTALVKKLLLEAAGLQKHVFSSPRPSVLFSDFGANSLDFTLNVFIDDLDNSLTTLSALRFAIERLFAEKGIDIPFPQLTLHMPEGEAPATPPQPPPAQE
ncbi:MAG: mechanosensitive ion channel [Desulfovibrio sp.]|jgi:small-conductance mechanosensitive channel|nr:mechanosensitive ion channel [Desulfovibrio sp.]